MLNKVRVQLRPLVTGLNLPTVIKTTTLPGDSMESLIIATQVGEIYYVRDGVLGMLLDIRPDILELGTLSGGYDERGLLGLAFHPNFHSNGLFYLHYSVAGTQGPGALTGAFEPDPCNPETLNLRWADRETKYNHIDTVEEWVLLPDGQSQKSKTLLNLRRPFLNHNGVNSLTFSPETGRLVLTTGDGGSGYDPFNLSQDIMEIAGKIIEIDISMNVFLNTPPVVTRFEELPAQIWESLTVIAKGVRNISGISYQRLQNRYIKYVGNVGQDLAESIFSFDHYSPIPVTQIVEAAFMNSELDQDDFINFGWRGWEGEFPTPIIRNCPAGGDLNEKAIAYYGDAIIASNQRIRPLTCYYHEDPRPDKFSGTALTGVKAYMGNGIPDLSGGIVFTDFVRNGEAPPRGVLAYTRTSQDCKLETYSIIDVDYDFESSSAFYTCLGTNQNQTTLYLGVNGTANVTDFNQGTVYEIIP